MTPTKKKKKTRKARPTKVPKSSGLEGGKAGIISKQKKSIHDNKHEASAPSQTFPRKSTPPAVPPVFGASNQTGKVVGGSAWYSPSNELGLPVRQESDESGVAPGPASTAASTARAPPLIPDSLPFDWPNSVYGASGRLVDSGDGNSASSAHMYITFPPLPSCRLSLTCQCQSHDPSV